MNFDSNSYSPRPGKDGLPTPTQPGQTVPEGEGHTTPSLVPTDPAERYLSQDNSLNPVSGQSIQERQVTHPRLKHLQDEWKKILADVEFEFEFSNYNYGMLLECIQNQVAPFVEKLYHFSVIEEKLTLEQIEEFRKFVSDVTDEINPDAGSPETSEETTSSVLRRTLGNHASQHYKVIVQSLCKQLTDRQQLNDMLSMPDRISAEIARLQEAEEKDLNINAGKNNPKPTTTHTCYQNLEQTLGQSAANLEKLKEMPPTADIGWVSDNFASALKLSTKQLSHCPESIHHFEQKCLESLEDLSSSRILRYLKRLYDTPSTSQADPEDSLFSRPLLGESLNSLTSLDMNSMQPEAGHWSLGVDEALPDKPGFPFNPIEVKNFQGDQSVTLKPVTADMAEEFQQKIRKPDADTLVYQGFKNIMKEFVAKLVHEQCDTNKIMNSGNPSMPKYCGIRDPDIKNESCPNLHSQVSITCEDGTRKALCANHIQYDGQPAGIAMSAPEAVNVPYLMQMAWENDSHVFLDLLSKKTVEKCQACLTGHPFLKDLMGSPWAN